MMELNLQMTADRKRIASRKGANARHQKAAGPFVIEPSEGRELTPYEEHCMDGHTVYLKMLQDGTIKSKDQPSEDMQVIKQNRGPNVLNPMLDDAVTEFDTLGGSMYSFCKINFRRFEYSSCAAMYAVLKRRR